MNLFGLDKNDRRVFAHDIATHDLMGALNLLFTRLSGEKLEFLSNELSLRHTAWVGLVDNKKIKNAIVIETGIGANVIALSQVVENVYALYLDEDTKYIVENRVENKNVQHILMQNFPGVEDVDWASTVIISYNDLNDVFIKEYFMELVSVRKSCYYYYICRHGFSRILSKLSALSNDNMMTYHIEGSSRDPYKMVSQNMKMKYFGRFKYVLYDLYMRFKNEYIVATNLSIEDSEFDFICSKVFHKKKYFIENIYFIKPNGALLAVNELNNKYMLRITSDSLGKKRLLSNNFALNLLEEKHITVAPSLYQEINHGKYLCSVEECFKGKNITEKEINNNNSRNKICRQATDILISIHTETSSEKLLVDELYNDMIVRPVTDARDLFPDKYSSIFDLIEKHFKKTLWKKKLNLVLSHGDYSVDNIMIENGLITGVIDWEYSKSSGLPLVDLMFFICSVYKKKNKTNIIDAMQKIILDNEINGLENSCVDSYCDSLSITNDLNPPLRLMCIVMFIAYRLEINMNINRKEAFGKDFGNILENVKNTILK